MPYSHKFSHQENYRKWILKHNKYIDDHRIIPITGVNIRTMSSKNIGMKSVSEALFEVQASNSALFTDIYSSDKKNTKGNWNCEAL